MASEIVNLRQRLHDETGVIMVNKITNPIYCVKPGAVGVLAFQNEIQISLGYVPVFVVRKKLRSTRQEKCPVGGGVDHSPFVKWSVGAIAGRFRCFKVLDVMHRMPSN